MKRLLAIDLGASGGRGIVGIYDGGKVTLDEVHRFESAPAYLADGWHWDIVEIFRQIKLAMTAAARKYGKNGIDGMAIDSWGVDYALLDKNGALLQTPFHYRDTRTDKYLDEIHGVISKRELYNINGLQFMNFNTVYQLYAHLHDSPYLCDCADTFLMIPQILGFFLTGEKCCEYTDASTTGLLDAKSRSWDKELCRKLGIPEKILPEIRLSGTVLGRVKKEIANETGLDVTVYNAASHDTASAVSALPALGLDSIYISSGTWSLMGVLADEPIISDASFEVNFTNEGSPERKIRFLRNIMGMWLIQQARKAWNSDGRVRGYSEIAKAAEEADFEAFIDPDYPVFGTMCDMPEEVKKYCLMTGQNVPKTEGEIARCIYESLALKYRENAEKLEKTVGKTYEAIQIVGGGVNNELMCKFTANACKKKVAAGPVEATAMGNILVQLIGCGEISGIAEAGKISAASEQPKIYLPEDEKLWDEKYQRYLSVIKSVK